MVNIIQQICENMVKSITKILKEEENLNISNLFPVILEECKRTSLEIAKEYINDLNLEIRKDKIKRKKDGLVLKEKDLNRKLITCLGEIEYKRDLYLNKNNREYVKPVDVIFGVTPYERISKDIKAELVDKATFLSYEKSKELVGIPNISRQSVRNAILKSNLKISNKRKNKEKKQVKNLHIYADEDHVHLQKQNKSKGKANQIVPLVTITEGTESIYKSRRKTINPYHIVNNKFDTEALWESVDKYIQNNYDVKGIENIYLHADGGKWIKNGLEDYAQKTFVYDGFHIKKYISIIKKCTNSVNSKRIEALIKSNDREGMKILLSKVCDDVENEKSKKKCINASNYILNNWEGIVNRYILDVPGSCTEGQISHILSSRFSRNPMGWSKEVLGKLSELRVYRKNGNKIDLNIYSNNDESEYSECTFKTRNKLDWSIFDKNEFIFDESSSTRNILKYIGSTKINILDN